MFYVYEEELLGQLILNYLTKITLPKSVLNQLGNIFVRNGLQYSGKKKAHKHELFGPVGLGMTLGCPRDKPRFVPGTNPVCPWDKAGFLLMLHSGSPACPWDKPGLSLEQTRGRRATQNVYVLNVYVPFSLAKCCLKTYPGKTDSISPSFLCTYTTCCFSPLPSHSLV